jgi:hypothetical protein
MQITQRMRKAVLASPAPLWWFVLASALLVSTAGADPGSTSTSLEGDLSQGTLTLHPGTRTRAHGDPARALDRTTLPLFAPDGGGPLRRGRSAGYSLGNPGASSEVGPLFAWVSHDFGPEPRFGLVRHTVDARLGWLRSFMAGQGMASIALRSSLFAPDPTQALPEIVAVERMHTLMLESIVAIDLRDRVRDPRRGVFVRVGLQQAGFGRASSWDYVRATLDMRGYVPLSERLVLAGRFVAGALFVLRSHELDAPALYALDELGPFSQQLQGGGVTSHRGYRRGGLGGTQTVVADSDAVYRPVLVAGGTRRWVGSVELRMKVTKKLGATLFVDAGNVARGGLLQPGALNLAWGFGVRQRTKLGVLRAEWAFRPDALQSIGAAAKRSAPRACLEPRDVDCRPTPTMLGGIPGAFHLAFAEPF